MTVKINIRRGAKQIGGTCFEIDCNNQRIIIDLGFPLMKDGGGAIDEDAALNPTIENGILPQVEGLFHFQEPEVLAVILSHPHQDHYALMDFVHPVIPIYLGKASARLVKVISQFSPNATELNNQQSFRPRIPFRIGPFKITAIPVEVEGKSILYSGDLRSHGRNGETFDHLKRLENNLDCLILEGTTVGGAKRECTSEEEVTEQLAEEFKTQEDLSFVIAAGSNIDRIVSIYKAAVAAKKELVLDLYTVFVLDRLKKFDSSLPQFNDAGMRVFYVPRHAQLLAEHYGDRAMYKYRDFKISYPEIIKRRKELVAKLPMSAMDRVATKMEEEADLKGSMIFSMWSGYIDSQPTFLDFADRYDLPIKKIHTSGHATIEDLQLLTQTLQPKRVIPIHTLAPEKYPEFFQNVVILDDQEALKL